MCPSALCVGVSMGKGSLGAAPLGQKQYVDLVTVPRRAETAPGGGGRHHIRVPHVIAESRLAIVRGTSGFLLLRTSTT